MSRKKQLSIEGTTKNIANKKAGIVQKAKLFFKTIYGVITIIGVIGAFILLLIDTPNKLKGLFSTPQQQWEDQAFFRGILLPPYSSDGSSTVKPVIKIKIGTYIYRIFPNHFQEGVPFSIPGFQMNANTSLFSDLTLKIKSGRLYISTTMRYIANREVVGKMVFNKWTLFKSNILTFYPADDGKGLEVVDKQGNVVLSLFYIDSNTISLQGYFLGDEWIGIIAPDQVGLYKYANMNYAMNLIHQIHAVHADF